MGAGSQKPGNFHRINVAGLETRHDSWPETERMLVHAVDEGGVSREKSCLRVLFQGGGRKRQKSRHHPIVGGAKIHVAPFGLRQSALLGWDDALVLRIFQNANDRRLVRKAIDGV